MMDNKSSLNSIPSDIDDIKIWQLYILWKQKRITVVFFNCQTKETFTYLNYQSEYQETITLNKVQNLIYENPLILNDYKTTILIESNQFTLVPSEFVRNEESAYDMMECIYRMENSDVWVNSIDNETILFNTSEGIQSFIYRTFPTAKILFQSTPLISYFKESESNDKRNSMIVNIDETRMEIIAISNNNTIFTNIFSFKETSDIIYFILNVWNMLGFDQENDELKIYGSKEIRNQVMPSLRKFINYVMLPILPHSINGNQEMDISLQISIHLNNK